MKTIYLGTSGFAATVLRSLSASPHSPVLVVTPPDRPRGRGRKVTPTPVASAAEELGLELLKAETVNGEPTAERILATEPELGLVCAFGQLIAEPLLSSVPFLNVHPSALPRWRGAAPIERAIMAGDAQTAVSVMRLTAGLDSGPVALTETVAIGDRENFGELEPRLAELGGRLLVAACDAYAVDELEFTEQGEDEVTYAEKITPDDRHLDPSQPAIVLARAIRALTPHVGAYFEVEDGERLGIEAAEVIDDQIEPGAIVVNDRALVVGCGSGSLRLEQVKPAGKRAMPIADYLRGHHPPARFV